jgi:hypothetical protein
LSTAKSLAETLQYRNVELVYYFAEIQKISLTESEQLFEDVKKWLWFCAQNDEESVQVYLFAEHDIIDQYWHTFLLFTEDYVRFCNTNFGRLIFHSPEQHLRRVMERSQMRNDPALLIEENAAIIEHNMREVGRVLGNDTMMRWYKEIPTRYKSFQPSTNLS